MKKSKRVKRKVSSRESRIVNNKDIKDLSPNFWKAALVVFLLILLVVIFFKNSLVQLQPAANCVQYYRGVLYYNASHNGLLWDIIDGNYTDGRVLCYSGKWYEAAPANPNWNWFIDEVASECQQVGSWHIAQGSDVWIKGTLPGNCVQNYVLTCSNVDFNCDTQVTDADTIVFLTLYNSLYANSQDLTQAMVDAEKAKCLNFGNYLQTLLGKQLFGEVEKVGPGICIYFPMNILSFLHCIF